MRIVGGKYKNIIRCGDINQAITSTFTNSDTQGFKNFLNNNKKVLDCAKNLPLDCLLWETDAPYQTLKNQQNTFSSEIFDVYKAAWNLRSDEVGFDNFVNLAEKNFKRVFE